MIVRLDKEQQKLARRQLLGDDVYVICHEALKQMQTDGHTELSPVEVFLSAQNFCKTLLDLPDIAEGLDDEIDDLEEESTGKNDAMLVMVVAATQMQAISKRQIGIDFRNVIFHIFEYLDNSELLLPLIGQMANKEDTRRLDGKKVNLLKYEMSEIEIDGGGSKEIKELFENFVSYSDKMDTDSIKGQLLILNRYNIDHNHVYDTEMIALYDKLGISSKTLLDIKEYNAIKHVENEIHHVESGGTGVNKEYHKN